MEETIFEDTKNCPTTNNQHQYEIVEEWDGARWITQGHCKLCDHAIDWNVHTCKNIFNKEHKYLYSSHIEADGIKFITKTCIYCRESYTYQSKMKGIKWKQI